MKRFKQKQQWQQQVVIYSLLIFGLWLSSCTSNEQQDAGVTAQPTSQLSERATMPAATVITAVPTIVPTPTAIPTAQPLPTPTIAPTFNSTVSTQRDDAIIADEELQPTTTPVETYLPIVTTDTAPPIEIDNDIYVFMSEKHSCFQDGIEPNLGLYQLEWKDNGWDSTLLRDSFYDPLYSLSPDNQKLFIITKTDADTEGEVWIDCGRMSPIGYEAYILDTVTGQIHFLSQLTNRAVKLTNNALHQQAVWSEDSNYIYVRGTDEYDPYAISGSPSNLLVEVDVNSLQVQTVATFSDTSQWTIGTQVNGILPIAVEQRTDEVNVYYFDVNDGQQPSLAFSSQGVGSLGKTRWSPDGQLLALASSKKGVGLTILDTNGTVVYQTDMFDSINEMAWSANGQYLAVADHFGNQPVMTQLFVWDSATGVLTNLNNEEHYVPLDDNVWSPTGAVLVDDYLVRPLPDSFCDYEYLIRLFDVANDNIQWFGENHKSLSRAYGWLNDQLLLIGNVGGPCAGGFLTEPTLVVFDTQTEQLQTVMGIPRGGTWLEPIWTKPVSE